MKNTLIKPKQFLILLVLFGFISISISKKIQIKEYNITSNTAQISETLEPKIREDEVKAVSNNNGICGSPVVIYDDNQNCLGGGSVDIDYSENNGGRKSGTMVYSKELSLKVSKVTIPLGVLSGSDIPTTNIKLTKDSYLLPSASSLFTDRHEDVRRAPFTSKVVAVEYDTWATKGKVSFSELDEPSQEANIVVDEYAPSNTERCATCSTNPDKSEKIAKVVNDRSLPPDQNGEVEAQLPVLMCKGEDSVTVNPTGVSCIDEEYSILKRVTAIFSGSDWEECNKVEYDDEGNIISDGRCIDIEDIVLDLSGIFENTNTAYKQIVDSQMHPGNNYNGELALTFPAYVEIDGRGIYKVSAKINVPYEYWRMSQEFDDIEENETPTSAGIKAFIKYTEALNRGTVKF